MYLKKGSYTHATNEVAVSLSRIMQFSQGVASRMIETWNMRGRTHGADQTELSTNLAALEAAYLIHGEDLVFYFDNGTASQHALYTSNCYGGTRVVQPISYPDGRGAQYTTYRDWTAAVEGIVLVNNINIIEWNEYTAFTGGGSQFGYLEPINGLPQKQLLKQSTPYKAIQQGTAVGLRGYPFPPQPLWPYAEHVERRQLRYDTPQRFGQPGFAQYTEWRVSWSYEYEDAFPFPPIGPTLWPV